MNLWNRMQVSDVAVDGRVVTQVTRGDDIIRFAEKLGGREARRQAKIYFDRVDFEMAALRL